jgi:GATA-binding protein
MKKQEIKRRKRVVPAGDNFTQATPSTAVEHSASPDPATAIESREEYTPEPKGPLAIDFTHYYGGNAPTTSHPNNNLSTPSYIAPNAPSPRKRSRSITAMDHEENAAKPVHPVPHRPNAISSILNPRNEESNIDPSLSTLPRGSGGPSSHPASSQEDKMAKRERLRREAEAMRLELERRQKELEDLEND